MSVAADVMFEGRVQGVGFRYTTLSLAAGYDVAGWVANLPDGRVQLHAEGTRGELDAFFDGIRESQLRGFIKQMDVAWGMPTGCRGFEIR